MHQIQLVSPSPSCSTAFLVLWQGLSTCSLFAFFVFLHSGPLASSLFSSFFLFNVRSSLLVRITFSTQLCLVLYSFRSSWLHWLIMWLTVSFCQQINYAYYSLMYNRLLLLVVVVVSFQIFIPVLTGQAIEFADQADQRIKLKESRMNFRTLPENWKN